MIVFNLQFELFYAFSLRKTQIEFLAMKRLAEVNSLDPKVEKDILTAVIENNEAEKDLMDHFLN